EFEGLAQPLHVRCGAGYSRCEPRVIIAGERQDWRLDLGHGGSVWRRTVEADSGIQAGDRSRALPCHASAVAETGDTTLAIGAWQLERVVASGSEQLHLVGSRPASKRLGKNI